MSQEPALPVRC